MSNIKLEAVTHSLDAKIDLPGSKSIANRVLLLAAIAHGESTLHNIPSVSEDVVLMLEALVKLGVRFEKLNELHGSSSYKIHGCDGVFPVKNAEIFCGNSGTTIRFLTAALALMDGNYVLTGIERMKERPIADLVVALNEIGANISYMENAGYPPLKIQPFKSNQSSVVKISGKTSSQYLTAILMALPLIKQHITVQIVDELISKPYIDITLGLQKMFGCEILAQNNTYSLNGQINGYVAINYTVEPDASTASYFLAMGALRGNMTVKNLSHNSLQGDKDFATVLNQLGASVEYLENAITVRKAPLHGIMVNMENMPDVAMTLATLALFTKGKTIIHGVQSWMVKETDRLQAMYNELTKLGAMVTITESSIKIEPPLQVMPNVAINTYNDHRMAMCFSLVAVAGVPVIINDYECVGKTYANYFEVFKKINYES